MGKTQRLKNSKLAQLQRKKPEKEEFSHEKELTKKQDRLEAVMQRIDRFLYGDENKK